MLRKHLEHILRASKGITDEVEFIVIGSQAVLVQHPDPPAELLRSNDLDIYPANAPEKAEEIDANIGLGSQFDAEFGYHADGVGPETAVLPPNWRDREVRYRSAATGGATAIAPEIHDLAASKLFAGRPKDLEWTKAAVRAGLVDRELLLKRINEIETDELGRIELAIKRAKSLDAE